MVANSFSGFILFNVCLLKKKKIFSDQCKVWNKVIMNQELYNHLKSVLHSLCFHIFHLSHSVVFRLSSRLLATYPGPSSFWRGDVDWEHLDNLHDCEKRILISVSKLWTPTILQRSFTSHDFTGNPKFWRPLMFQTYPLGGDYGGTLPNYILRFRFLNHHMRGGFKHFECSSGEFVFFKSWFLRSTKLFWAIPPT